MSSSDEEEQNPIDLDICNETEIANLFKQTYNISSEEAISLEKCYILYLDNSSDFDRIVAGSTNKSIHVYDLNDVNGLKQLRQLDCGSVNASDRGEICGVRFANGNSNIVYVSTVDGGVDSFDLRAPNAVAQTFRCDSSHKKPLTCFDLNINDTIICAGTEESSCEAYLLYFDVRKSTVLGAYADSHKDDVTTVKFHPSKHNILASGSIDGLINVFNIAESSEEDALEYCLNTESSVQTVNWHTTDKSDENRLSCVTHTNDFQFYNVEESESIYQCTRNRITEYMKRKSSSDCYLVNSHSTDDGGIFLIAGSNFNRGECLRSLTLTQNELAPRANFTNNKQIIRCSLYDPKNDNVVTAGEGGIISLWGNTKIPQNVPSGGLMKSKKSIDRKVKPY